MASPRRPACWMEEAAAVACRAEAMARKCFRIHPLPRHTNAAPACWHHIRHTTRGQPTVSSLHPMPQPDPAILAFTAPTAPGRDGEPLQGSSWLLRRRTSSARYCAGQPVRGCCRTPHGRMWQVDRERRLASRARSAGPGPSCRKSSEAAPDPRRKAGSRRVPFRSTARSRINSCVQGGCPTPAHMTSSASSHLQTVAGLFRRCARRSEIRFRILDPVPLAAQIQAGSASLVGSKHSG